MKWKAKFQVEWKGEKKHLERDFTAANIADAHYRFTTQIMPAIRIRGARLIGNTLTITAIR